MSYESEEMESDDGRRPAWVMPATALAVVAVVAGGWLWWRNASAPPAVVETPVEAPSVQVVEEQVQHPLSDTPAEPSDAPVPLPALEDSDAPLAAELATLVGAPSVSAWLVPDGVARRFVATVDNLTREKVTERIRAVRPVSGAFAVDRAPIDTATGEERITLASENYARYAPAVRLLTALDVRQVGQLYRTYYPLLQQAYEDLGYPGRYFNDRLVEVIDHLQAAPSPAQPPALVQPKVMYEFADAALESRSAGQKLMIRMGPQNAATVKSWLASLRAEITRITPAGE